MPLLCILREVARYISLVQPKYHILLHWYSTNDYRKEFPRYEEDSGELRLLFSRSENKKAQFQN